MDKDTTIEKVLLALLFINAIIPLIGYLISFGLLIYILLSRKKIRMPYKYWHFLCPFILYIIFTTIKSQYKIDSLIAFICFALNVNLFILLKNLNSSINFYKKLLKSFLYCSIIVSIVGILQYYLLEETLLPSSWIDSSIYDIRNRAFSTLLNPNVLGGYLVLTISLIIPRMENRKISTIDFFILAINTYCLVLTYSRGAWITLLIIILLSYIFRRDMTYVVYGLFFLMLTNIGGLNGFERLSINNALRDNSFHYRLEIYDSMFKIIKDNFLFGTGLNTMQYYINEYSQRITAKVYHGHNIFLNLWAELGIVGLSFVVVMIYNFFSTLNKVKKSILGFSILLSFLSVMIHGLIDAVAITPQFMIFFVYILALIDEELVYQLSEGVENAGGTL